MSDTTDKTLALNIRLKPFDPAAHPKAVNHTSVGVAQGIASLDFGFIAWSSRPSGLFGLSGAIRDRPDGPNRPPIPSFHPRGNGGECPRAIAAADSTSAGEPGCRTAVEYEDNVLTRGQE